MQNFAFIYVPRITASQDTTIWISLGMQVAKTRTYPVVCRFPLVVPLYDHNPPTLQTDRQTDRQTGGETSCLQHKRDMLTWHFALIIIDDDNDDVKGQCHTVTECAAGVGLQVAMTAQVTIDGVVVQLTFDVCLLYTSPSPRDRQKSRMPSSA